MGACTRPPLRWPPYRLVYGASRARWTYTRGCGSRGARREGPDEGRPRTLVDHHVCGVENKRGVCGERGTERDRLARRERESCGDEALVRVGKRLTGGDGGCREEDGRACVRRGERRDASSRQDRDDDPEATGAREVRGSAIEAPCRRVPRPRRGLGLTRPVTSSSPTAQ